MRAAELMVREAAGFFTSETGKDCGAEANMARNLAAEASWAAADMCVQTHGGGFGFAEEFDIERKFRETRLYTVAPISTNLILSLHCRACARVATGRIDDSPSFRTSWWSHSNRRWRRRCAPAGSPTPALACTQARTAGGRFRPPLRSVCPRRMQPSSGSSRGKESVVLDLVRSRRQGAFLEALIRSADIFVQNLKPGTVAKFGFPIARLRRVIPRLICSISGFGEDGLYATAQGLRPVGDSGRGRIGTIYRHHLEPSRVGVSVVDVATGMDAYEAILKP